MKPIINWSELQALTMPPPPPPPKEGEKPRGNMWDASADMYNMMASMEREYTYNQINCIPTTKDDTVLDIGCGPGRISVLISERVKSVTSIDTAEKMMAHCRENAKAAGAENVNVIRLDWNDKKALESLPKHDIVIASRSVGMHDMIKLNSFANKYCAIVCWANSDSIPDVLNGLFEGTSGAMLGPGGRKARPRQDRRLGYNVMWNIAYDLGFDPNINIVTDGFTKTFKTREEAYNYLRCLRKIEDNEMPIFKKNVDKWLTENEDGTVTFRRETKSFVMCWQAKPQNELNLF